MQSHIVSASKATDFFVLHFLCVYYVTDHSVLAEPHSGDSSTNCVFTSLRVELPLMTWEFGVGFSRRCTGGEIRKHLIRVHRPDKSSAA